MVKRSEGPQRTDCALGIVGGVDGTRNLRSSFSKVVMARDFWSEGFESPSVTAVSKYSQVLVRDREATTVFETCWRRRTLASTGPVPSTLFEAHLQHLSTAYELAHCAICH